MTEIVTLVTKPNCPQCVQAKNYMKKNGIEYTEYNLSSNDKIAAFIQTYPEARALPQFLIGKKRIGDFSQFKKFKENTKSLRSPSKTYKPFLYPWAVDYAVEHEKMHWIEDEIDLAEDVSDWKTGKLTEKEKEFIINILRLFTQSDVAVGKNYYDLFIPIFQNNEIRNMLGSFASREAIHQRSYALLNDTLGLPESEYEAFLEYKEMSDKIDHMANSDTSTDEGIALALAKSVFNEGVTLFASFVMLLNFQRFGKMKGMGKIVEFSIRDETIHLIGNAHIFRVFCEENAHVVTDVFKKKIYDIARKTVELEDKFIELVYDSMSEMDSLTKGEVCQYIRYITDRRLTQLGLKPNYSITENPLPWLDWVLNGTDHTNFFENRVTEYTVAGLSGEWKDVY